MARFAVKLDGVKRKRTLIEAVAFVKVPVQDKATGQAVDHIVFLSEENRPVAGFPIGRFDGAEIIAEPETELKPKARATQRPSKN